MGVEIKLDYQAIAQLEKAVMDSAESAMDAVRTDLINSRTLPADQYVLQNGGTYIGQSIEYQGYKDEKSVCNLSSGSDIHIALTNDVPQSRRLYYHPEYNFQKGKNSNAGAYWFEPYLNGEKKDFLQSAFESEFKRRTGV